MTLKNKLAYLPPEQSNWLLLIKAIYKRFNSAKSRRNFISVVRSKAEDRGYKEIYQKLDFKDLEIYFKT